VGGEGSVARSIPSARLAGRAGPDGTNAADFSDDPQARIRNWEAVPKATGSSCGLETQDLAECGLAEGGSGTRSTAARTTNPIKIQIRHQVDFNCLMRLLASITHGGNEKIIGDSARTFPNRHSGYFAGLRVAPPPEFRWDATLIGHPSGNQRGFHLLTHIGQRWPENERVGNNSIQGRRFRSKRARE
jgi:hypothetical protein